MGNMFRLQNLVVKGFRGYMFANWGCGAFGIEVGI